MPVFTIDLCDCFSLRVAAYQVLEFPSLAIECKRDLEQRVGRDLMAIRMRKYSMGLVETDSKTDKGKHAGRAAFKWIIRSILRGQQGSWFSSIDKSLEIECAFVDANRFRTIHQHEMAKSCFTRCPSCSPLGVWR